MAGSQGHGIKRVAPKRGPQGGEDPQRAQLCSFIHSFIHSRNTNRAGKSQVPPLT